MSKAEHTFVIPAYKNSPYLEECVTALRRQKSLSNVIIATSTPSVYIEGIAAKYDIPYYVTTAQSSIASDWNFAIQQATTRYVTVAHQDDIYDENYTKEILRIFHSKSTQKPLIAFTDYADIVNGQLRKKSMNTSVKRLMLLPFWFKNSISSRYVKMGILSFGDPICCPSVTIDRQHTNDPIFSTGYTCALDWVAWLDLARQKGAFLYIPKILVWHRIHIDSETTRHLKNGNRQQEESKILSSIWPRPIARLLAKLYAIGYADNNV